MTHDSILPVILALLLTTLLTPCALAAERPNIVFLMADDLGWNDVGYHGSEIRTPNIDRLASRGVQLDRYYAWPVCSPTRAALLTGRSPLRMGVDRPIELRNGLPLDEQLLPQVLKAAGYQTMMSGKWHLGLEHADYFPNNRGFDHAYGHLGPAVDYFTHIWDGGLDWHRDGQPLEQEGYTTHLIAAEAIRLLEDRDPAKPTFLYVAFNAPHGPLQVPAKYIDKYANIENRNRRTYAGMVDAMDEEVGRILATLEDQGMTQNTILVWCSDNGGAARLGASNKPLRGGKGGSFEGGIRVPAVIWQPGVIEGGGKFSQMMTAQDWLPTLADAAGISLNISKKLDGVNMWPGLKEGKKVARPDTLVVGVFRNMAVIHKDWKYVENQTRGTTELTRHLFRLSEDPNEEHDLAAEHPEVLEKLAGMLRDFARAETVAPDVTLPGAGRGRPRGTKKAGPPRRGPGRGGGATGWSKITRPPWAEAAKRN